MVTEALTGTVLGGLLRLAPEALRLLDRRSERRHELQMQKLEFAFAKSLGPRGGENSVPVFTEGTLDAMRESYIQAQAEVASKRYPVVAALAALVRPGITFSLMALYAGVRIYGLTTGLSTYGDADLELFSSVLAFWFLGRVYERRK